MYGHVITKFSRMGRLLHFLAHDAPLARFARELRQKDELQILLTSPRISRLESNHHPRSFTSVHGRTYPSFTSNKV